ncbi:MAG TPA: nitroreductase family protein, partial [Taishania sp.]|nr:nitroreductase family protein [Taishania sp.]
MDHPIIKQLNWRYATKRYDSSKKIDTKSIEIIKEAIRLAPSSYGLQPIKVIIVENEKLRQQIKTFSFNQQAITEASHLFILCAETAVNASTIDKYMQMTSEIREIPLDQLMGYSNFLKTILENQTASQKLQWAQKQAYIALGILVDACAN